MHLSSFLPTPTPNPGPSSSSRPQLSVQIKPKKRAPISKILLVGGATRMPGVRAFLKNMTGLEAVDSDIDPDQAVALGAAVQVRRRCNGSHFFVLYMDWIVLVCLGWRC